MGMNWWSVITMPLIMRKCRLGSKSIGIYCRKMNICLGLGIGTADKKLANADKVPINHV